MTGRHLEGHGARSTNAPKIISVVFLAFIFLPGLMGVTGLRTDFDLQLEQRPRTPFPALLSSHSDFDTVSREFEAAYLDHIGFRRHLIKLHSYLKAALFGVPPNNRTVFGIDGWMYTAGGPVDIFLSKVRFDAKHAGPKWFDFLETRNELAKKASAIYKFTVAPDKLDIYPEYFPPRLGRRGPVDFLAEFGSCCGLQALGYVPLRDRLVERKFDFDLPIYYRTDFHWNQYGAEIAVELLIEEVAKENSTIPRLSRDDLIFAKELYKTGSEAINTGLPEYFAETEPKVALNSKYWDYKSTEIVDPAKLVSGSYRTLTTKSLLVTARLRTLVIHDSFGDQWINYFPRSFGEVIAVGTRAILSHETVRLLIEIWKPDVIIEELAAAKLTMTPPERPTTH
uniref:AlgX/AlgJ SGNH hydrolase-like domain-containing protein n=1 Tax=Rhodopseudomonas palustris (strain BisA53) TaxID=316055 RepID=Q07IQ1_RHOP5